MKKRPATCRFWGNTRNRAPLMENAFIQRRFQIVDKIPKRLFVLGFCHPFSVIENPCSLGRASIGAQRMVGIREHRRAGLTTNARVCRHAETPLFKGVFLFGHLIDLSIDAIRICKTKGMMPEQIRVHSYQILSVKKQRVPQSCPKRCLQATVHRREFCRFPLCSSLIL